MALLPQRFPRRTAIHERRFAYVRQLPDGKQALWLAELNTIASSPRAQPIVVGTDIAELHRVVGYAGFVGRGGQEPFVTVLVSPNHRYLVAHSEEAAGFHDQNIRIYDLANGREIMRFNEHSLPKLNRATCRSREFDGHMASLDQYDIPQAELDAADYTTDAEGAVPRPHIAWTTQNTLMIAQELNVIISAPLANNAPRPETFIFEFDPTAASRYSPLGCNHRSMPRTRFGTDNIGIAQGLTGRVLHYSDNPRKHRRQARMIRRGKPLPFVKASQLRHFLRRPNLARWYRPARLAAGRPRR